MRSRVTRLAIAAGAGLMVLAAGSATAQAQAKPVSKAETCLVNVDTNTTRCFGTFREAVAVSTEGRITDAPLSGKDAARDRKLVDRLRVSSAASGKPATELAILYEHWNFGGKSIILNGNACQSGNGRDYVGGVHRLGGHLQLGHPRRLLDRALGRPPPDRHPPGIPRLHALCGGCDERPGQFVRPPVVGTTR